MTAPWDKPYSDRDQYERLQSTWRKASKLMGRGDWSAAIVRAATAAEMACNIAVRHELREERHLEPEFVDHLLRWANGMKGKLDKLLSPLPSRKVSDNALRIASSQADEINRKRNEVVHSGDFMNEEEAQRVVSQAESLVEALVQPYCPEFTAAWSLPAP